MKKKPKQSLEYLKTEKELTDLSKQFLPFKEWLPEDTKPQWALFERKFELVDKLNRLFVP